MLGIAFAMAGQPASGQGQGNIFTSFLPLIIIFVIFYFLLIRPQQKQQKKTRAMISSVKRGDKIVTRGGLHGTITGITDKVLQVEIAENVKVKMNREAVALVENSEAEQAVARKDN